MEIDLNNLCLEEKLGQMMMVGFNGIQVNDRVKTLILKYKVGGFILYRKNFNSYEEMLKLINDLKMRAIRIIYGYKLAVRQAFTSGSDIVLFRFEPRDEKNAIEQAYNMAKSGVIGVNVDEINARIDKIREIIVK